MISQAPASSAPLRALSEHMRQWLAGWFSPGLVQLRRIGWETCSGHMLERIMQVGWAGRRGGGGKCFRHAAEAVHPPRRSTRQ